MFKIILKYNFILNFDECIIYKYKTHILFLRFIYLVSVLITD